MKTLKINALEVVKLIRGGANDAALMARFGLTAQNLQRLFAKLVSAAIISQGELERRNACNAGDPTVDLDKTAFPQGPPKPVIDALEAIGLIRAGWTDMDLMRKYNLSSRGVQSLLRKLLLAGAISQDDIENRIAEQDETIRLEDEFYRPTADFSAGAAANGGKSSEDTFLKSGKYTQPPSKVNFGSSGEKDYSASPQERGKTSFPVYEIRSKSKEPIYCGESTSLAALVEKAVAEGLDLSAADLSKADLSRAKLAGAKLVGADLAKAYLVGADLTEAHLTSANLVSANLFGANLYKANLAGADLSDANLSSAHAVWAFMPGANLSESNLTSADFSGAHMGDVNLFEAIMDETKLKGAYLEGVDLQAAKCKSGIQCA